MGGCCSDNSNQPNQTTQSSGGRTTTTTTTTTQQDTTTQDAAEAVETQSSGTVDNPDTTVTTEVKDDADNKEDIGDDNFVTRYEIRSMSKELQNRFFDAIDKMLETKNGVSGTSEFYRCASYHGNPAPIYCKHGRETFPGWHRIYLLDFEKALRKADIANGNDGNIGLPYWDWSIKPEDGLPSIIRERFNSWPNDLFPNNIVNNNDTPKTLIRNNDNQITSMLNSWNVISEANDCLLEGQHFAHASTGGQWASNYPSIESPHNYVHVIVGGNGGPMGSVAWAAYDIAFWLHHCNIDRIYESYLSIEPDSEDEFRWRQRQQENNLFEEPFEPFFTDENIAYYPKDTFNIKKLGFIYDKLWPTQKLNELRLPPTIALFPNVKVSEFESKCYQIHCFVINKNEEEKFIEPITINDINYNSINYAGGSGIFGRGMECKNCQTRLPYDLIIDISKTLINLKLSRYNAKLKIYILETTKTTLNLLKIEDTPLPKPIITGPLFESQTDHLKKDTKDTQNKNEVKNLQKYLKRFGYYDDEIDGLYGPITEKAVLTYQTATGYLEKDGWVGEQTKGAIKNLRRCSNKDSFAENKISDERVISQNEVLYDGKKTIKYWIGISPAYISRRATNKCIDEAFNLWSNALNNNIKFERLNNLEDEEKADIKLTWSNKTIRENELLRFDGPGGVLGIGGYNNNKGFVIFDMSERWVIGIETQFNKNEQKPSDLGDVSTWYRGQPAISLFYTAVHEIGHALGLDHSIDAKDFMSPFYDPNKRKLGENDVNRVKAKFGIQ